MRATVPPMRFDLFSSGRLYKALEDAGYPDMPAKRTLQDWIRNDSAPQSARLAVARIIGLDTQKEAPPHWAEALANRVADRVIESLAPGPLSPNVLEALPRLIAALEASPPPSTEGTPERSDTGYPVEQSQAGPIAGSSHERDG